MQEIWSNGDGSVWVKFQEITWILQRFLNIAQRQLERSIGSLNAGFFKSSSLKGDHPQTCQPRKLLVSKNNSEGVPWSWNSVIWGG